MMNLVITRTPFERTLLAYMLHRCDETGLVRVDIHDLVARTGLTTPEVIANLALLKVDGLLADGPDDDPPAGKPEA